MEERKYFVTSHGHWGNDQMPDERFFVCLGKNRTSTGKSWEYAWAKKESLTPHELAEFIETNANFWGSVHSFEFSGNSLFILAAKPGPWIGAGGRWVKAMSQSLQYGRVHVKEMPSFKARGSQGFVPVICSYLPDFFPDVIKQFSVEAESKIMGRESVISDTNDHSYCFDLCSFNPRDELWLKTWLNRISAAEEDAKKEFSRLEETVKKVQEEHRGYLYLGNSNVIPMKIINGDFFPWAIDKTQKIKNVVQREQIKIHPAERFGVYLEYIYLGKLEEETIEKIKKGITDNDYEIVQHESFVGQYEMRRK
jgi:hypothetical protein